MGRAALQGVSRPLDGQTCLRTAQRLGNVSSDAGVSHAGRRVAAATVGARPSGRRAVGAGGVCPSGVAPACIRSVHTSLYGTSRLTCGFPVRVCGRLGDTVLVSGQWEVPSAALDTSHSLTSAAPETGAAAVAIAAPGGHAAFLVHRLEVLRSWRDERPGQPFLPQPAPRPPPTAAATHTPERAAPAPPPPEPSNAPCGTAEVLAAAETAQRAKQGSGASAAVSSPGVCKYWAAGGRCTRGATCAFAHPQDRGGEGGAGRAYAQGRCGPWAGWAAGRETQVGTLPALRLVPVLGASA